MENIELGFILMLVGMTTVFFILFLIIELGKALISLVNKYAPAEVVGKRPVAASAPRSNAPAANQTTVAIISAVSVVTGGQGKVVKIEKD